MVNRIATHRTWLHPSQGSLSRRTLSPLWLATPTTTIPVCVCDKTFNVEHALSCPYGGFPSIRHNEIRDITAHLMSDICHNVGTEPVLQPVTDERLTYRTVNLEDGARLDIKAQGFWGNDGQCTVKNLVLNNTPQFAAQFMGCYCNTGQVKGVKKRC